MEPAISLRQLLLKKQMSLLQRMQDSSDKPKPKVLFEVGEVVSVIDGPFADFNGVVEEVNYEKIDYELQF